MLFAPNWGRSGVARRGRKRKAGSRYTSGKLKTVKRPDDRVRASRQPHRREVNKRHRLSEKAESLLGRLNLRGLITDEQFDAGEMFAAIVGAYRAVIGTPQGTAGSGRGFGCIVDQLRDASACWADRDACGCYQRKQRYDRAFEALGDAGRRALLAVNRVAVHGQELAPEDLVYLGDGLDQLARHFGLTAHRRPGYFRNAQSDLAPGA